ncbi:GPW/gp25 family protein [Nocardia testacea]|uniref:GPW/gp25 family protein n=1 Tax=Nocardia testacea TaxID=248551 RepID=UPI0002F0C304|nr:GPW/gp25 family protein [Nocardia testacea]
MPIDFIGSGWNYPVQVDAVGGIALATGSRDIEQAIELILRTAPGERPMRPEFGCRVHEHIFSPANEATAAAIAADVHEALSQWEPRIDVLDVGVRFDPAAPGTCYIDVAYSIHERSDVRNLVFPFYLIVDEPEESFLTTQRQQAG